MNKTFIFIAALLVASSLADDRVVVDLYYESLCPGCQNYIETEVTPSLKVEGFETIANLRFFPYGNANTNAQGVISCQHGTNECYGNILENCALAHIDASQNIQYLTCIENSIEDNKENFDTVSALCFKQLNIPAAVQTAVKTCQKGDEGQKLHLAAGKATDALQPAHEYVPWIVVNGEHTEDIQSKAQYDLVGYVCSLYKGTIKIPACTSTMRKIYKFFEFKNNVEVCPRI